MKDRISLSDTELNKIRQKLNSLTVNIHGIARVTQLACVDIEECTGDMLSLYVPARFSCVQSGMNYAKDISEVMNACADVAFKLEEYALNLSTNISTVCDNIKKL